MGEHSQNFSDTDIHILETGLKWIKEAPDEFANKLYYRLLQDQPEISVSLRSISPPFFSRNLLQFLDSVIGELRLNRSIQSFSNGFWAKHLITTEDPIDSERFTRMAQTYLDVFSDLAEDAWSPALESAWEKAIEEVSRNVWKTEPRSLSPSTIPSLIQIIKRKETCPSRAFILFLGILVIVAGGLISKSLWNRCRVTEMKLLKSPIFKKAWSN